MNENEILENSVDENEEEVCVYNDGGISWIGFGAAALAVGTLLGLGIEAGKKIPEVGHKLKSRYDEGKASRKEKRAARKALKHGNQDDSDE